MKSIITFLIATLLIAGSLHAQSITSFKLSTGISHNIAPDLVVTSIKLPYVPPAARIYTHNLIQLKVKVTIKNQGNDLARNGFGIRTNLKFGGKELDTKTIARLSAGKSATFMMTINVPASYNGRYIKLSSMVDSRRMVRESNENNNYRILKAKLPRYRKVTRRTI